MPAAPRSSPRFIRTVMCLLTLLHLACLLLLAISTVQISNQVATASPIPHPPDPSTLTRSIIQLSTQLVYSTPTDPDVPPAAPIAPSTNLTPHHHHNELKLHNKRALSTPLTITIVVVASLIAAAAVAKCAVDMGASFQGPRAQGQLAQVRRPLRRPWSGPGPGLETLPELGP